MVLGLALTVVLYLFSRQDVDPRLRLVLVAATLLYGVRLYLAAMELRRRKRQGVMNRTRARGSTEDDGS